MHETKRASISKLSNEIQITILLALLTGSLITTFASYEFMNLLAGLRQGDPIILALLVSIIGIGFILMDKLGIDFSYKEEIEQANQLESAASDFLTVYIESRSSMLTEISPRMGNLSSFGHLQEIH